MTTPIKNQRLLTGPMIVALSALLVLAIVTVWVVATKDDATEAAQEGSGNVVATGEAQVSEDPEPAGTPMEAYDGSFSTTIPEGYTDGEGLVGEGVAYKVLTLYDTNTNDESMPTHIVITAPDDDGTAIDDVIAQVQSGFEDEFGGTTEGSEIDLQEIDGEPAAGWQSSDYWDGGSHVNSTQFATIHDGKYYFFTVNSMPKHTDGGRAALAHIMQNLTWG